MQYKLATLAIDSIKPAKSSASKGKLHMYLGNYRLILKLFFVEKSEPALSS
jgi:hypothetical protein